MKCEYGCGKNGQFKLRNGKLCCSPSYQSCENMKRKNSNGLKKAHELPNKFKKFDSEDRRKSNNSKVERIKQKPFELWGPVLRYKQIFDDQNGKCFICSIESWQSNPIKLELDHIDGNNQNNKRDNLRLICPNCHSQTDTFRGRNINSGKIKVTDDELIEAYNASNNIYQTLIRVGLSPRGGNYIRMKKIIERLS